MKRSSFSKTIVRFAEDIYDVVMSYLPEFRATMKQDYPKIEWWATGKKNDEDGIFLTQGFDEIWLTPKHARKLIEDLQERFPPKK